MRDRDVAANAQRIAQSDNEFLTTLSSIDDNVARVAEAVEDIKDMSVQTRNATVLACVAVTIIALSYLGFLVLMLLGIGPF